MPVNELGEFASGYVTTTWLLSIGMTNIRQVAAAGVVDTCIQLRRAGYPVSLNMAYGLQADAMGLTARTLPAELRKALGVEYRRRLR